MWGNLHNLVSRFFFIKQLSFIVVVELLKFKLSFPLKMRKKWENEVSIWNTVNAGQRVWNYKVRNYNVRNYKVRNYKVWNYKVQNNIVWNYKVQNYKVWNYKVWNYKVRNYKVRNYKVGNYFRINSHQHIILKLVISNFVCLKMILNCIPL